MEAFVKVLGVALIILFAGLLVGTSLNGVGTVGSVAKYTIFSAEVGRLGLVSEASRTISFGNVFVGYVKHNQAVVKGDKVMIKNGILRDESKAYVVEGEEIEKITISFNVEQSNFYGDLIILLNGNVVYKGKPKLGEFSLELDDVDKTHNEIEIKASSSGLKFWAPTTYVLSNLVITKYDYSQSEYVGTFELYPYEVYGFNNAKLSFYVEDSVKTADLTIQINGNTIFSGKLQQAPSPYEFDINKADVNLVAGENEIHFFTDKDAYYVLKDVSLSINYYGSTKKSYKTYSFDLDKRYLDVLEEPNTNITLYIKVDDVFAKGEIDVNINNKFKHEFYNVDAGDTLKVMVDEEYFKEGKNTITISTTGSYEIERMDLVVSK